MSRLFTVSGAARAWGSALLIAALSLFPGGVRAITFGDEKTQGALDVTLTYGAMWRLKNQDAELLADFNGDDANRNFSKGLVSNQLRAVADFEVKRLHSNSTSFGVFVRGRAIYDNEIWKASNDHDSPFTNNSGPANNGSLVVNNSFTKETQDRIGWNPELLDAFVYGNFLERSAHPLTLRIGRQVINWGESAFIQTGISSVINPADISSANIPGTEVKEILRPLGQVYGNFTLTPSVSVEAYYQWEWEQIINPPYGSFLSNVPDFLSVDGSENLLVPNLAISAGTPLQGMFTSPFATVDRYPDRDGDDGGQFGVALRVFAEKLGASEFGFYYARYNRKLPDLVIRSFGGTPDHNWFGDCAPICLPPSPLAGIPGALTGIDTASYQLFYADDVDLYAFSWNTTIFGATAFSGEIAYHKNVPIQTLKAQDGLLGTVMAGAPPFGQPTITPLSSREDMVVAQATIFQDLNFVTFADDASLILEVGYVKALDMDGREIWRGNTLADDSAWGYRAQFGLTWYDALNKMSSFLSGVDLRALLNINHDVNGTSAIPGGSFTDGAKAIGVGVEADWQNTWSVSLTYTNFFGDGTLTTGAPSTNTLDDRDNIGLAIKYRF